MSGDLLTYRSFKNAVSLSVFLLPIGATNLNLRSLFSSLSAIYLEMTLSLVYEDLPYWLKNRDFVISNSLGFAEYSLILDLVDGLNI